MSKVFGQDFVVVNDVVQQLDTKIFLNGPWVHLATVKRGLREYMAFKHLMGDQAFVEIVDPQEPGLLKRIKDDQEWVDIVSFLKAAKLLEVGGRAEIKTGKAGLPG
jgi:hypothetical protein